MSGPIQRPKVSNPELRAALDKVGAHIENYEQTLNHVSNDIKAIEKYLTDSGVRQEACVEIGWDQKLTDGDPDVAGNYSGGVTRYVDQIKWSATTADERSRWRLMYEKVRHQGQVEIDEGTVMVGPTFSGKPEMVEEKPLIEMPVAMRLQAHRHLADLVFKIGQLVEFTAITNQTSATVLTVARWKAVATSSAVGVSVPEGGDAAPNSEEAE